MFLELARKAGFGYEGDGAGADEDADEDSDEGEGGDTGGPAACLLEGDGVGFEEEVEDSVDEGHVKGDEEEDGFLDEHDEGTEEIGLDDGLGVEFDFISFTMNSPIFCFKS